MIDPIITLALNEDMPNGDITTDSLLDKDKAGEARLVAKQNLVLSGADIFEKVFKAVDSRCHMFWKYKDGDYIANKNEVCRLVGPFAGLLKAERTALNFLGHLSGVATMTRIFVESTKGTKAKINETRKTLPGLRLLEKMAVVHGGGVNHRMNLSTGILVKENHLRSVGGITKAVKMLRDVNSKMQIEVEVSNFDELREAIQCGVEKVLLDNMSTKDIAESVKIVNNRCLVEASGNMTLARIPEVSQAGVDFISVGLLTHSAPCADLSLLFEEMK